MFLGRCSCQHGDRLRWHLSAAVPLVCICGPSAAGKTTFAAQLAVQLRARGRQPLLIACDDYYRSGWSPDSRYGFDTVDAIDVEQLRLQLTAARYRQLDSLRHYNMRTREVGVRSFEPGYDLILIEGSYGPNSAGSRTFIAGVYIETLVVQRLFSDSGAMYAKGGASAVCDSTDTARDAPS